MTECGKQAHGQGLGWISTGVLVLFAFLITLPFAGQSTASTTHLHAGMKMDVAPHDHQGVTTKLAITDSQNRKNCEISGHIEHGTHICCFQNINEVRSSLRRDLPLIGQPVFASSSQVFLGLASGVKQSIFAVALERSQPDAPQLGGLIGAAAEFLHTQRLLT